MPRGPGRHRGGTAAATIGFIMAALALTGMAAETPPTPPAPPAQPAEPYPLMPPSPSNTKVAPKPKPPLAAQAFKMVPKARPLSTLTFEGRVETLNQDVRFEAPPAYMQSFNVWSKKMKGLARTELIQYLTITQDKNEDGTVPFHRKVPRFMVELEQGGHPMEPYGPVVQNVQALEWEGTLDVYGNLKEYKRTAGAISDEIKQLGFPILERAFPLLDGPRDLKVGEGFTDVAAVALPTRLTVHGFEDVGLLLTRKYVLKENVNGRAVFEVKTTFAMDPAKPPTAPQTRCTIGGGGTGEAVFDVSKGVFLSTRLPGTMTIDFEAPLHPLPGRPETQDPGIGKSHIQISLLLSATQQCRRIWGEDTD